jgi:hypothetical protein
MMQSLLETASLSSLQRSSQLIGCAVRDALFLGMRIVHPAIQGFARVCSLVGVSNNTLPTLAATRLGSTGSPAHSAAGGETLLQNSRAGKDAPPPTGENKSDKASSPPARDPIAWLGTYGSKPCHPCGESIHPIKT